MPTLKPYVRIASRYSKDLGENLQTLHAVACDENPVLAILLLDLLKQARDIEARLSQLAAVLPDAATKPHEIIDSVVRDFSKKLDDTGSRLNEALATLHE